MPVPEPTTYGWCEHSQRWLIFSFEPDSCPEMGLEGQRYCPQNARCGYYEDSELTPYAKRKLAILQRLGHEERMRDQKDVAETGETALN